MSIEPQLTVSQLLADVEEQRTKLRKAEERLTLEVERVTELLPPQLDDAKREVHSLWARIHELESDCGRARASEVHYKSMVQAKDEEIASLIARLKDYEAIQTRLRELEPPTADDLKRIYGIGPVLEKKLNDLGITKFEQIGRWGDAEIESFQAQLTEARIRSDAWVKGAREQYFKKYRRNLLVP